jgi:hypothetical protein
VLISVPIFMEGRSPTSHWRKFVSRFSKRARIFSAASFLSTAYHQSVVLQTDEDCRHISRLDNDGVSKCHSIRWEMFFYPSEGGGGGRTEQKQREVIFTDEIALRG